MAFEWRDYIRIDTSAEDEFRTAFYAPDGTYTGPASAEGIYDRLVENRQIIEATLSQISLIPEMQDILIRAGAETPVTLVLSASNTAYNAPLHQISLNPADVVYLQFPSSGMPERYSLQQALIHEFQHAAEREHIIANEINIKQEALSQAIEQTTAYNPDYAAEYAASGTIAGLPLGAALQTSDVTAFDTALDTILANTHAHTLISNLPHYTTILPPDEFAATALSAHYDDNLVTIVAEHEEIPIIENTNAIMARYYPEATRDSIYANHPESVLSPPITSLDSYMPSLAGNVHPTLDVTGGTAPTAECTPESLLESLCADIHIEGVSYDANTATIDTPDPPPTFIGQNKASPIVTR